MKRKNNALHYASLDCCKNGLFEKGTLRKTTNPGDVTCSNCVRHMSSFAREHRKQILHEREVRKHKRNGV